MLIYRFVADRLLQVAFKGSLWRLLRRPRLQGKKTLQNILVHLQGLGACLDKTPRNCPAGIYCKFQSPNFLHMMPIRSFRRTHPYTVQNGDPDDPWLTSL